MCFSSPGVKNADENELKDIASPPVDTHVYNVADFNVMNDIVDGLTKVVCERVEQLDRQLRGPNAGRNRNKCVIWKQKIKNMCVYFFSNNEGLELGLGLG